MRIYQLLTFAVLGSILFFPYQLDTRINYIIFIFGVLLLPLFIKKIPLLFHVFKEDLARKNYTSLFFIGLIISTLISTFFSINLSSSIFSLILIVTYFIVFHTAKFIFPDNKAKNRLIIFFVLINFFLAIISLYYTLINYGDHTSGGVSFMRVYFGHNHLSALLLFSIPLSFYLLTCLKQKIYKLFFWIIFVFLMISLYLTFARVSIISLLTTFLITFFLLFKINKRILILSTLVSSIIIIFMLATSVKRAQELKIRKFNTLSLSVRLGYWQQSFDNFLQHPLIGSGPDTFRIVSKKSPRNIKPYTFFSHNLFIQLLTDMGIIGFIANLGLLISIIISSFKKLQKSTPMIYAIWIGMTALVINGLFDYDWQIASIPFIFWLLAGIL
ncbi:MAG: O-antigen ligase family protein [Candidatus Roizmanbacteria bacterium]|nr:MAG: O-antigen ligase family protein [Candidatus Roizmanbacteria bacterium]